MSIELKIKAKSLAVEARYIRKEEVKQRNYGRYLLRSQQPAQVPYHKFHKLREHRLEIRAMSRATGLARAFIKGTPYVTVEKPKRGGPDKPSILRMVKRYGDAEVKMQAVTDWMEAA